MRPRHRRGRRGVHPPEARAPRFKGYRGSRRRSASRSTRRSCTVSRRPAQDPRGRHLGLDLGVSSRVLRRLPRSRFRSARARERAEAPGRHPGEPGPGHPGVPAGAALSDVSHAVQSHVEAHGFAVVRAFVGTASGGAARRAPDPQLRGSGTRPTARAGWCWRSSDGHDGELGGQGPGRRLDAVTQDGSLARTSSIPWR